MEQQSNIRTLDSSIFLNEGAFVRWKGQWFIFQGPFEKVKNINSQVFSISCIDFFGIENTPFLAAHERTMDSASWHRFVKAESNSCSFKWEGISRKLYAESFAQAQSQISSGNWKKAVPIAFDCSSGTLQEKDKRTILARLSEAPESLVPYGFWKDGKGMVGLTPEILFYRDGENLESMALAGTEQKKGTCHLLQDDKNLNEHRFVVQELVEKLGRYGDVQAKGPQILELPTLYHLITIFKVVLTHEWNDLEALLFFHPTSALGIAPFKKWRELERLPEQKDRNFFGAPFLLKLGEDKSLALVALRQIQWDLDRVRIGAGGGVVQESQEKLEWFEILAKIESVKKLMGIT